MPSNNSDETRERRRAFFGLCRRATNVRAWLDLDNTTGSLEAGLGFVYGATPSTREDHPHVRVMLVGASSGVSVDDYDLAPLVAWGAEIRRAPFDHASSLIVDDHTVWTEFSDSDGALVVKRAEVARAAADFDEGWEASQSLLPPPASDVHEDAVAMLALPARDLLVVESAMWERRIHEIAAKPDDLYRLDGHEFEDLVAELLARDGYDVEMTSRSHDGGRDILAFERTPTGDHLFLVECKRYAQHRPVGVSIVRAFYGVVTSERATGGLLVSTSHFSREARSFRERDPYRLALNDYNLVSHWVRSSAAGNWRSREGRQSLSGDRGDGGTVA